ncbi:methyltransferase [Mycolicibacterium arabiense]|uniref:Methyltransferase n=1 Tax=Mycolicibacterium arabiense TaxID=1286181 RepID=A0A7I7RWN3_9MYCO|nr:class I SAM-dependent methyltransferase [Mycolicibacterium arabiense]MCV7373668.1 class I SAM-dependent methyltransferase [Mycolicibacterium arabiense]BBY48913.1 methyltransferase [Mycolicibacterium arabiense]
MDFLDATRRGYDATAREYADAFHHHLDDKPLERAMLGAFAGYVQATGNHRVADVGCGTGATTAILHDLGIDAAGSDLSPGMIGQAKALNPHLRFAVGSMTAVDSPDASVGGVCAWYSTIHVPDAVLPEVFAEFRRVLVPGGVALLAFQAGEGSRLLTEAFGVEVDLEFRRRTPAFVTGALDSAGLAVFAEAVRAAEPGGIESTPQAFLLARRVAAVTR